MKMMNRINVLRALRTQAVSLAQYSSNGGHIVQMRGLDYETTEQDIIDFFKPLGIMPTKVHLRCDGSGRTSGFSEVEFNTHTEAVIALRKKNAFIGNRFIRLALKSSSPEAEAMKYSETQTLQSSPTVTSEPDDKKKADKSPRVGHFVRMNNMPWRITDQDIFDFFCPVGARPISVHPVYNENGIRTGQFDVMFSSLEEVQKAVVKNNAYLRTKYVHLSLKES